MAQPARADPARVYEKISMAGDSARPARRAAILGRRFARLFRTVWMLPEVSLGDVVVYEFQATVDCAIYADGVVADPYCAATCDDTFTGTLTYGTVVNGAPNAAFATRYDFAEPSMRIAIAWGGRTSTRCHFPSR